MESWTHNVAVSHYSHDSLYYGPMVLYHLLQHHGVMDPLCVALSHHNDDSLYMQHGPMVLHHLLQHHGPIDTVSHHNDDSHYM